MGAVIALAYVVALGCGIASLVCFILVLIEMFKRQQTGLAIACIVLAFCTGIGTLIAFVYGWMKGSEWGLGKVMRIWTACLVAQILALIVVFAVGMKMASQMQGQMPNLSVEELRVETP